MRAPEPRRPPPLVWPARGAIGSASCLPGVDRARERWRQPLRLAARSHVLPESCRCQYPVREPSRGRPVTRPGAGRRLNTTWPTTPPGRRRRVQLGLDPNIFGRTRSPRWPCREPGTGIELVTAVGCPPPSSPVRCWPSRPSPRRTVPLQDSSWPSASPVSQDRIATCTATAFDKAGPHISRVLSVLLPAPQRRAGRRLRHTFRAAPAPARPGRPPSAGPAAAWPRACGVWPAASRTKNPPLAVDDRPRHRPDYVVPPSPRPPLTRRRAHPRVVSSLPVCVTDGDILSGRGDSPVRPTHSYNSIWHCHSPPTTPAEPLGRARSGRRGHRGYETPCRTDQLRCRGGAATDFVAPLRTARRQQRTRSCQVLTRPPASPHRAPSAGNRPPATPSPGPASPSDPIPGTRPPADPIRRDRPPADPVRRVRASARPATLPSGLARNLDRDRDAGVGHRPEPAQHPHIRARQR